MHTITIPDLIAAIDAPTAYTILGGAIVVGLVILAFFYFTRGEKGGKKVKVKVNHVGEVDLGSDPAPSVPPGVKGKNLVSRRGDIIGKSTGQGGVDFDGADAAGKIEMIHDEGKPLPPDNSPKK